MKSHVGPETLHDEPEAPWHVHMKGTSQHDDEANRV